MHSSLYIIQEQREKEEGKRGRERSGKGWRGDLGQCWPVKLSLYQSNQRKNKTKNNSKDEKQKIETEENEKQNKKG